MTQQETDSHMPMSVQESPVEAMLAMAWCRVRGTECNSASTDLLKEVIIIFITSTIVWSQVKQQGRNTALPINRKLA